jgi:hypothetical protein
MKNRRTISSGQLLHRGGKPRYDNCLNNGDAGGDPLADVRIYPEMAGDVASRSAGTSSSKNFTSGFPVVPKPLLSQA